MTFSAENDRKQDKSKITIKARIGRKWPKVESRDYVRKVHFRIIMMQYQRSACIRESAENRYQKAISENADLMPSTKKAYIRAITRAIIAHVDLSDALAIGRYAKTLSHSNAYALRGAMLAYAEYTAEILEAQVTPGTYQTTAAAVMRLRAVARAVKPRKKPKGTRAHTWLSRPDVARLLSSPDIDTTTGLRDCVVLALLVGAGLRREEVTRLAWGDLMMQGERQVLQVKGKGAKYRIVPISQRMMGRLDQWRQLIQSTPSSSAAGCIVRRVLKGGKLTTSGLTVATINRIVARHGENIGRSNLQPHDLRRTYAQIGIDNGISIEQVSGLLGHASISTTQRYLNIKLDLIKTISDFVPM